MLQLVAVLVVLTMVVMAMANEMIAMRSLPVLMTHLTELMAMVLSIRAYHDTAYTPSILLHCEHSE